MKESDNERLQHAKTTALLSVGTFLEFFDLFLYVHMAQIINPVFFPQGASGSWLLGNFALLSTFMFRPIGALIFGRIGDVLGRKITVIVTTMMSGIACVTMAALPGYESIGMSAQVLMILCRVIQGMSAMGEVTGAEIYLLELTKPPRRYFYIAMVASATGLGGLFALATCNFILKFGLSWRYAFAFGSLIAVTGGVARTALREAPEFTREKMIMLRNKSSSLTKTMTTSNKVNIRSFMWLLAINAVLPMMFCLRCIHIPETLQNRFGFSTQDVINCNLAVSTVEVIVDVALACIVLIISPIKIVKYRAHIFLALVLILPPILEYCPYSSVIILLQMLVTIFYLCGSPATPIFYSHFPTLKRFTVVAFAFAFATAASWALGTVVLDPLKARFGAFGLWAILIPLYILFALAVVYFERLEKKRDTASAGSNE
ncbi:MFS transporter [Candidatus Sneabacter namystus]|uniref:MHS family MFS transporter n=1 Tax=Candidatus Sneabacter namystus TaxID=2601646 RepID=A0A5C0UJY8_9RICK|nr:MFS transporter [Candidatus Sneabacter namystus]QEK39863.1 MHS family MFS transporter [Candidatus Sneabacter namystus]